MKHYLFYSFIAPFHCGLFRRFSFACLFGAISVSLMGLMFAFDMSAKPASEIMQFYLTSFAFIGLLVMPLGFVMFGKLRFKVWYSIMVLLTLIPFVLNLIPERPEIIDGLMFGLIVAPFWTIYHILMMQLTGNQDKGTSIALALNMIVVGSLIGLGIATWLSTTQVTLSTITYVGCILNTASIVLMLGCLSRYAHKSQRDVRGTSVLYEIVAYKKRTAITLMFGFLYAPSSILWPIFLLKIGFTMVLAGLFEILSCIVRVSVSGLAGRMSDRKDDSALRASAILLTFGKLPWLLASHIAFIPITVLVWSVARHFKSTGYTAMWYRSKSINGLAASEALLAIGRVAGIVVFVPLLFASPQAFILLAMIASLIAYVMCWPKERFKVFTTPIQLNAKTELIPVKIRVKR